MSVFPGACAPGLGIRASSARIGTSTQTMGDWRWSGVSASVCRGEGIARRIQEAHSCLRIQKISSALCRHRHRAPLAELFPGSAPPTLPPPRGSDSARLSSTSLLLQTLSTVRVPLGSAPPPPQARPHLDGSPHLGHGPLPVLSTPPRTQSLPPGPEAGLFIDSISPRDPGLSNCPLRP